MTLSSKDFIDKKECLNYETIQTPECILPMMKDSGYEEFHINNAILKRNAHSFVIK
ncbi:hypothetical protein ACF0H5_002069 [Mactra antiquata]